MYIRSELEPTGWDSEGCMSEYLWYKFISAKSSRSFLSPSIDCTFLGKWSPSRLWQFTGTVMSSQEDSPISPPEILLLLGSLPGISPSSLPVRCPWYLLYSTLVIYCSTKPVRLSFRLVLWVIGCLKTTVLFCSQFLRSGLWEGLGWVHSFGVCPQGCPHIAGWSLETHARLWLENPQLALLHGWGFLPHGTWILGRVSENKCSERHTQKPQSYFLPGLELPHITCISFLLVLTLNLPLPLLLKKTGAWTRGIRAWSPDPRGKGLGLHLSVLEAAEDVRPYFHSHMWPQHSRLSTKDPLWLVGRLLQSCLQTQCPAPAHTCSLTEGMSQYSSAKAGERQIRRHTEAPYMWCVCIVYVTRLEINHSLVSLKVWGQPSVGALDFKNLWASFNGTVWSDSLAEKDFIQGAGVQVGQWGHATRARRGTGSAWLVCPGRSFSQLFMLWFKPLTVSLSHPSPRCEGCLWNKGLTQLVLGKCGKVSFCHPQLKLHSLQNFIYSKVLIYPQTSCFAKYTTLLLEQGCGFRVWVVPFLLNAGRLRLGLSLVVPAHDGRQVGIQPALSSSSGQSQCEACWRQAFVWRISPGAPGCGEDLQEVCAHCQPRPIDWVFSPFYRLRGFMGSPKIYLHCQVSVMEGRTRRWIRREGTVIRRENPTLARPQPPEAEIEGHKLLWTASLDSRRWPVKPLSSSL